MNGVVAVRANEIPDDPSSKGAARLCRRIRADVQARGWPVGEVLGSESELLDTYGVSRAVFREAVRLLEHLGVGHMRRGPGGGFVITAPSMAAAVDAVLTYLLYADVDVAALFEARSAIEAAVAELAAQRADDEAIAELRRRVEVDHDRRRLDAEDHHVLHLLIARATDNPAAELFVEVLGRLSARYSYPKVAAPLQRRALDDSAAAHAAIVAAIASGNSAAVAHRMRRHLDALGAWITEERDAPRARPWDFAPDAAAKGGERVARSILRDVLDRGWPVGTVLGSEAELIEQYGVSRSVVREAVRILEHHQVASMRRGPGGGLVVKRPDLDAIIDAAAVYLDYRGIRARHLTEMRRGLERLAVRLATERATPEDIARLRAVIEAEHAGGPERSGLEGFHEVLAGLSGNPAVALFTAVLERLAGSHAHATAPTSPSEGRRQAGAAIEAHEAIVAAIASGDAEVAERRMQRHLEALEQFVESGRSADGLTN